MIIESKDVLYNLFDTSSKTERPVLWAGAGLSKAAGYPLTNELLGILRSRSLSSIELPKFAPYDSSFELDSRERSFDMWIDRYIELNGTGELYKVLREIFSKDRKDPAPIHKSITTIPWASIYTTNYDRLIEDSLLLNGLKYTTVNFESNIEERASGEFCVYKIHGSAEEICNVIISKGSYQNYSSKFPILERMIDLDMLSRRKVFFGCSMTDPRIYSWIENLKSQGKLDSCLFSVAILPRDAFDSLSENQKKLLGSAGIRAVLVDSHHDLEPLISDLSLYLQRKEEFGEEHESLFEKIETDLAPLLSKHIQRLWIDDSIDHEHCRLCEELEFDPENNINDHIRLNMSNLDSTNSKLEKLQLESNDRQTLVSEAITKTSLQITKLKGYQTKLDIIKSVKDSRFLTEKYKAIFPSAKTRRLQTSFRNSEYGLSNFLEKTIVRFNKSFSSSNAIDPKNNLKSLSILLENNILDISTIRNDISLTQKVEQCEKKYLDIAGIDHPALDEVIKILVSYLDEVLSILPTIDLNNIIHVINERSAFVDALINCSNRWSKLVESTSEVSSSVDLQYRTLLTRKYDSMTLFGLDLPEHIKRYNLTETFVDLHIDSENRLSTIEELLLEKDNVLLDADAGGGKSTLMQWLLVRCCNRDYSLTKKRSKISSDFVSRINDFLGSVIPIYIQLRYLDNFSAIDFYDQLSQLSDSGPDFSKSQFDSWLKGKPLLLLIDGFDEVPKDKRSELLNWIESTRLEFGRTGIKVVLTSRPAAISNQHQLRPFIRTSILPLNQDYIERLIDLWYGAAESLFRNNNPNSSEDGYVKVERIKSQLSNNKDFRELAETPLLCAVMCALNYQNPIDLVRDKLELIEKATLMMVDRRSRERGERTRGWNLPEIGRDTKIILLGALARNMLIKNATALKKNKAAKLIAMKIGFITDLQSKEIDEVELCDFLIERTGLLREPVIGEIDFIHKLFQEYLASRIIIDGGFEKNIVRDVTNPILQECMALTILGLPTKRANQILLLLFEHLEKLEANPKDEAIETINTGFIQAIRISKQLPLIDPKVRKKANSHLMRFVPPNSAYETRLLVQQQEHSVELLKYNSDWGENERVNCINCLAEMEHPKAAALLADYLALSYSTEYSKRVANVLRNLNLDKLNERTFRQALNDQANISKDLLEVLVFSRGYYYLLEKKVHSNLIEKIELSQNTDFDDDALKYLGFCKNATTINLADTSITNITPLMGLPKLQSLNIAYTETSDISDLLNHPTLEELNIIGCPHIDEEALSGFSSKVRLLGPGPIHDYGTG